MLREPTETPSLVQIICMKIAILAQIKVQAYRTMQLENKGI